MGGNADSTVGIIFAGGSGTRLAPYTGHYQDAAEGKVWTPKKNKQLLPVGGKPQFFYPLSNLIEAGLDTIVIVSSPEGVAAMQPYFGDGKTLGIDLLYVEQPKDLAMKGSLHNLTLIDGQYPGLLDEKNLCIVFGDAVCYNNDAGGNLAAFRDVVSSFAAGSLIVVKTVDQPRSFGVVEIDDSGTIISIEEKPLLPRSNLVVGPLHLFDTNGLSRAEQLLAVSESFGITDMHEAYMRDGQCTTFTLNDSVVWYDMGTTPYTLKNASADIHAKEAQDIRVGNPYVAAASAGFIEEDPEKIASVTNLMGLNRSDGMGR